MSTQSMTWQTASLDARGLQEHSGPTERVVGAGPVQDFAPYSRPLVHRLLAAVGLDVQFERGEGDTLFQVGENGERVKVLDFLGGFGASLLGHNHPEILAAAEAVLAARRPFNAQGSVRGSAGQLARRLSDLVGRRTGQSYVVTFASTGAEAVEAAIKHAELERVRRNRRLLQEVTDSIRRMRRDSPSFDRTSVEQLRAQGCAVFGLDAYADLEQVLLTLQDRARQMLERQPRFLAIEGAFHGKTTGALGLTHNAKFRTDWLGIGLGDVAFLPRDDQEQLGRVVEQSRGSYAALEFSRGGKVGLVYLPTTSIAACFAEPIQGEGGVHELSPAYLAALRRAADTEGFALVFDEIQSGMGRTGAFLASERSGIAAHYYLLSKSLGGGLAKISALLVERAHYVEDFGLLHTSTFADDDFSSVVALKALELLQRDGQSLIARCRERGEVLLEALRDLADRFPTELKEVRGRGLMIGMELGSLSNSSSPLLRVLADQDLLPYVAAGYLLREQRVRVGPTLAAHGTLRVQPSAFVSDTSVAQFLRAMESFLVALRDADVATLIGGLLDEEPRTKRLPIPQPASTPAWTNEEPAGVRAAFLVHFLVPEDLAAWEPRLAGYSNAGCKRFLERTCGVLSPFIGDRARLHSIQGAVADLTVIAVPFTPEQALDSLRTGSSWAFDLVRQAVELARHEGCSVVGLGGYTSIVSDNCRALCEDRLALTSGNSLTTAVALEAMWLATDRLGLDPAGCLLGVLGAAGNIGSALAIMAADRVGEIVLIGRRGSARLLEPVVESIYAEQYIRLRNGSMTALGARIAHTTTIRDCAQISIDDVRALGSRIRMGLAAELGDRVPIRFSTELASLRECELVISATNAPRPLIHAEHLSHHPIVVCDVAVPQDVEPAVAKERPNALIIRGGLVIAPLQQVMEFPGMRLKEGRLYGCMAETLLMAFDGGKSGSVGSLNVDDVRRMHALAKSHGFRVEERLS